MCFCLGRASLAKVATLRLLQAVVHNAETSATVLAHKIEKLKTGIAKARASLSCPSKERTFRTARISYRAAA